MPALPRIRASAIAVLAAVTLGACATMPDEGTVRYEASKDCAGRARCFAEVQAAIAAADADPRPGPVHVSVGPGSFNERVHITRSDLIVSGAGAERTRVHFALAAEHAGAYYAAGWGTPGSATMTIAAPGVILRDLAVENDFDYLANDAFADDDPRKIANSQAVALLLDNASDRVLIERVHLLGYQDTLFAKGKRAVVRRSLVAGNVDFIFGAGQLLIEDSELRTRRRSRSEKPFESFLLAPSTPIVQSVGLVVHRSRLTREEGVPDASVALARPWHPTTTFPDGRYADPQAIGMAVFVDCFMDAHIHPDHWSSMPGTARDGTKTAIFLPQDSRFHEAGSYGPGARHRDIHITWTPELGFEQMRNDVTAGWAD